MSNKDTPLTTKFFDIISKNFFSANFFILFIGGLALGFTLRNNEFNNRLIQYLSGILLGVFSSLMASYYKTLFKRYRNESKKEYPKLSILSIYRNISSQKLFLTQISVGISIVIYVLVSNLLNLNISLYIVLIPFSYVILVTFYEYLVSYRIKRGFYLTNEWETRNLVDFILSNANSIDFNDPGGKRKQILSNQEIEGLLIEADRIRQGKLGTT